MQLHNQSSIKTDYEAPKQVDGFLREFKLELSTLETNIHMYRDQKLCGHLT